MNETPIIDGVAFPLGSEVSVELSFPLDAILIHRDASFSFDDARDDQQFRPVALNR